MKPSGKKSAVYYVYKKIDNNWELRKIRIITPDGSCFWDCLYMEGKEGPLNSIDWSKSCFIEGDPISFEDSVKTADHYDENLAGHQCKSEFMYETDFNPKMETT